MLIQRLRAKTAPAIAFGAICTATLLLPGLAFAGLTASSEIGLGAKGYEIETADLNRDGRLDLISGRGKKIDVRRGKEGETFGKPESYRVGRAPHRFAVADLDRDGRTDIVSTDFGSDSISILYGRRDGFQTRRQLSAGNGPTGIAIGRISGDQKPDLAVSAGIGDKVTLFVANGGRKYTRSKLDSDSVSGPQDLLIVDLNEDGRLDLVCADFWGVHAYLGRGDGTYDDPVSTEVGTVHERMAAADMNDDGSLDLAITSSTPSAVFVLLGQGDGSFASPAPYTFGEGLPTSDLAIADIDGDTFEDLVTSTRGFSGSGSSSGELFISPGAGDGTFSNPTSYFYGGEGGPLEVGDFDESGTTDVTVSLFEYYAEEPVARLYRNEE